MSPRRTSPQSRNRVSEGASPANALDLHFPSLQLPIQPPFPPMEAKIADALPTGSEWQYEPKWDGFRCLAFRDDSHVVLQSKAGQPLGRYFPELVSALANLRAKRFVLDGEIVIIVNDRLSFDDLLMRIHPAASRIEKLSKQTPCTLLLFDLLVDDKGRSLMELPLSDRRPQLEEFFTRIVNSEVVKLSAATPDLAIARHWFTGIAHTGCDGVVAKDINAPYLSGERAMVKVKRIRTADCVAGGFRFGSKGNVVGSVLLGLYGNDGLLHHVGFTSSFKRAERVKLASILEPYRGGSGFTGNAPGGVSRWSTERSGEWERLRPELVLEVQYDHFSGGRFRHGTKFLRWRSDKRPSDCTLEEVSVVGASRGLEQLLAA